MTTPTIKSLDKAINGRRSLDIIYFKSERENMGQYTFFPSDFCCHVRFRFVRTTLPSRIIVASGHFLATLIDN
jgi:hypothetical protein